jgi:Uma2 family endonuclease
MKSLAKMTYELYKLLPDDGKRYEVIDGELLPMTPALTPKHQRIVKAILTALDNYAREHQLGEVYVSPIDVVLDEDVVVQPDVLFIMSEHRNIVGEEAIQGAPDLVVEVLSPSSFYHDLRRKMAVYSRFGVQEYWIVDPEKHTVEIHTPSDGQLQLHRSFSADTTLESPLLPALRLPVSSIFS